MVQSLTRSAIQQTGIPGNKCILSGMMMCTTNAKFQSYVFENLSVPGGSAEGEKVSRFMKKNGSIDGTIESEDESSIESEDDRWW